MTTTTEIDAKAQAWADAAAGGDGSKFLGPLGPLYQSAMNGEITLGHAEGLAHSTFVAAGFDVSYVIFICVTVSRLEDVGNVAGASALARMLWAALEELPANDIRCIWATERLLSAEATRLSQSGVDVPRLRELERLGERLIERQRAAHSKGEVTAFDLRSALQGLADVRMAFLRNRPLDFWDNDSHHWRDALAENVEHPALGVPEEAYRLDDADELRRKILDARIEVISLSEGGLRSVRERVSFASDVYALHASPEFFDRARAEMLVARADIASLAPQDLHRLSQIESLLLLLGEPLANGELLAGHSALPTLHRFGMEQAADHALSRLTAAQIAWGPASAADIYWTYYDHEIDVDALPDPLRRKWFYHLLHILDGGSCACHPLEDAFEALGHPLTPTDVHSEFARILHIAAHSSDASLATAILTKTPLPEPTPSILGLLRSFCCGERAWDAAVDIQREQGFRATATATNMALEAYLDAGLEGEVARVLRAVSRVLGSMTPPAAMGLAVDSVRGLSGRLASNRSDAVRWLFHRLATVSALEVQSLPEPVGLLGNRLHRWAFKAPALGGAILSGSRIRLGVEATEALERARAGESPESLAGVGTVFLDDPIENEEIQLLSFLDSRESRAGDDDSDRLANLRRGFNDSLQRLESFLAETVPEPTPGEVLEIFSMVSRPPTVIYDVTSGIDADSKPALYATGWHMTPLGLAAVQSHSTPLAEYLTAETSDGGGTLLLHPVATNFASLRAALRDQPSHKDLSRSAQALLTQLGSNFFQQYPDFLKLAASQGADHICILPTGAFTFAPLHLLFVDGHPLADDWTVSILPSPRLLQRRVEPPANDGAVIAASPAGGLPFGLHDEPLLRDQASLIAETGECLELVDSLATPDALLDAAQHARYVHIAAHGSDYPPAPSFQCIYLSATEGSDGRLFAYEVQQRDLSGVDLVTLSACESALGRVDVNDELSGMTAAFLKAGARAVVSALWPVTAEASSTFFVSLYMGLALKLSPLESFRRAQLATREVHPGYADWGAFVYFGEWRERITA